VSGVSELHPAGTKNELAVIWSGGCLYLHKLWSQWWLWCSFTWRDRDDLEKNKTAVDQKNHLQTEEERVDWWWSFLSMVSQPRSVLEVEMDFTIGPGAKPVDFTGKAGMLFLKIVQDICHRRKARCAGWLPHHWILLFTGSYVTNFSVHKCKLNNSIDLLTGYQWNEIQANGISKSDPDYSHMSLDCKRIILGWTEERLKENQSRQFFVFSSNCRELSIKSMFCSLGCNKEMQVSAEKKMLVEIWRSD